MALRQIRLLGDEILTKPCREVKELTPRLQELIGDMLETMYDANGVGLSAPQVGVLRRIVVIDVWQEDIVDENAAVGEEVGATEAASEAVEGKEPETAAESVTTTSSAATAESDAASESVGSESASETAESGANSEAEAAAAEAKAMPMSSAEESVEDSEAGEVEEGEETEDDEDGEDVMEGPLIMINPVIIYTEGEQTADEGCLSLPGKAGKVTRPMVVRVTYLDENMEEYELEGEGLLARAICHEVDHLEGHMYVDLVEGEIHDVGAAPEEEEESEEEGSPETPASDSQPTE